MGDLGVELKAVEGALLPSDGGERTILGAGEDLEIAGDGLDLISVAHPDGHVSRQPLEERIVLDDEEGGPPVLS